MDQTSAQTSNLRKNVGATSIPHAFQKRVAATPEGVTYVQHIGGKWQNFTWRRAGEEMNAKRLAIAAAGLAKGDRVGLLLPNGIDWISCDLAAMSLNLVTVPLCTRDSAEKVRHVIRDSGARLCIVDTAERWREVTEHGSTLPNVDRIWILSNEKDEIAAMARSDPRVAAFPAIFGQGEEDNGAGQGPGLDALATIIYTSGTTGPPKGVMLTHSSLLWCANAVTVLHLLNSVLARLLFSLSVRGDEKLNALNGRSAIFCPNHQSDLDVLAVSAALPAALRRRARWGAARIRVFASAFKRAFVRPLGVFPVDELAPAVGMALAVEALRRGDVLVWFPEGWRSPDGQLLPFHPGIGHIVEQAAVPVVPVFITGTAKAWARDRRLPRPAPISVCFGEPIAATDLVKACQGHPERSQ